MTNGLGGTAISQKIIPIKQLKDMIADIYS